MTTDPELWRTGLDAFSQFRKIECHIDRVVDGRKSGRESHSLEHVIV